MIVVKHQGSFRNTESFLLRNKRVRYEHILKKYAQEGVDALVAATPIDSGITADSWGYEIKFSNGSVSITWTNSHIVDGAPIAILVQYGHGTRNGGYVQGRDYINPAMKSIFDRIANDVWKEVTKE